MSKDGKWIHSWGSAKLRGACRVSSRVTEIAKGSDPSTGSSRDDFTFTFHFHALEKEMVNVYNSAVGKSHA